MKPFDPPPPSVASVAAVDAFIGQLVNLGVSSTHVVERTGEDQEVRIEHPELPGVLIIPISYDTYVQGAGAIGDYIIERLASALAEERNTPHGD